MSEMLPFAIGRQNYDIVLVNLANYKVGSNKGVVIKYLLEGEEDIFKNPKKISNPS